MAPAAAALLLPLLGRLAGAMLLHTSFVPDEYWQGPEVEPCHGLLPPGGH
jgi:hypothetical protein